MSYEKCHNKVMHDIMHEYKNKELKNRGNEIVTDIKQAKAIALTQAHSKCKRNKEEIKKLLNKVNKDLNKDKEINLTDIIETHDAIILLTKMKKIKFIKKFKDLLLQKIIKMQLNNKKLSIHIWHEIKKIYD
jgi:hypothetical protein